MAEQQMNRDELMDALFQAGVNFPRGMHVDGLRELVAANRNQNVANANERNDANNENGAQPANDNRNDQNGVPPVVRIGELNDDEAIEREMQRLQRRRDLLLLQRQVEQMENGVFAQPAAAPPVMQPIIVQQPAVQPHRRVDFGVLVQSIVDFTGDDNYDVDKWLRDFNDLLNTHQCDIDTKYLLLRRKLSGTAKLWLQTADENNYEDLSVALAMEFRKQFTRQEIYRQLAKRVRKSDETLKRYLIELQNIGNQCGIEDIEIVHAFIRGLRDTSNAVSMLYTARTIDELKRLLDQYEQVRLVTATYVQGKTFANKTTEAGKSANGTKADVKCYNCNKVGHISSQCTEPRRQRSSCFVCGAADHRSYNCPKGINNGVAKPKTVMAITPDDLSAKLQEVLNLAKALGVNNESSNDAAVPENENDDAIDALNLVSVAFSPIRDKCSDYKECFSIFDTGSEMSWIRASMVPKKYTDEPIKSNYHGVGGHDIKYFEKLVCLIKFKTQTKSVVLFVVPDNTMEIPLILGRDAIKVFSIKLTQIKKPLKPAHVTNNFN